MASCHGQHTLSSGEVCFEWISSKSIAHPGELSDPRSGTSCRRNAEERQGLWQVEEHFEAFAKCSTRCSQDEKFNIADPISPGLRNSIVVASTTHGLDNTFSSFQGTTSGATESPEPQAQNLFSQPSHKILNMKR